MSNLAAPTTSQPESPVRRFLKVPDVARMMEVPESTVYDLARQRRIGGMVRFGRRIRFDKDKFEHWLDQGGELAAA